MASRIVYLMQNFMKKKRKSLRMQARWVLLQSQRIWQVVVRILYWVKALKKSAGSISLVRYVMKHAVLIISCVVVRVVRVTRDHRASICHLMMISCVSLVQIIFLQSWINLAWMRMIQLNISLLHDQLNRLRKRSKHVTLICVNMCSNMMTL